MMKRIEESPAERASRLYWEAHAKAEARHFQAEIRMAKAKERWARRVALNEDRWARMDREMAKLQKEGNRRYAEVKQILLRLIQVLPDALREKMGFAPG